LRVSSVEAIPAIASYLAASGVDFHFRTNVTGASTGVLHTGRGDIEASTIVVAAGHDTDMLFPDLAEEANIQRCLLHMLEVDAPPGSRFSPVILTGTAVLRYRGLSQRAAAQSIRDRLARDHPDLLAALVNVKMSQRPNGRLVLGDTHAYAHTHDPFRDENLTICSCVSFTRCSGHRYGCAAGGTASMRTAKQKTTSCVSRCRECSLLASRTGRA